VTMLVSQFGYTICAINPLIELFIVNFGWVGED